MIFYSTCPSPVTVMFFHFRFDNQNRQQSNNNCCGVPCVFGVNVCIYLQGHTTSNTYSTEEGRKVNIKNHWFRIYRNMIRRWQRLRNSKNHTRLDKPDTTDTGNDGGVMLTTTATDTMRSFILLFVSSSLLLLLF